MRLLSCIFLVAALCSLAFAGAGSAPKPLPEDSVKILQARYKILEIWKSAQVYYQDRGEWPETVELLDSVNYIQFDSAMRADWTFKFFGYPPAKINATQNYLAKNARGGGMGLPHFVSYEIETGYWSGTGDQHSGLVNQNFNIQEVQASMFALADAGLQFYQDRGTTGSVVQLVKHRYVIMPTSVKTNWQIRMQGDSIVAISTDWMPDGADKIVVYFPKEQRFSGYGVIDPYHVPKLTPYLEYVEPKKSLTK